MQLSITMMRLMYLSLIPDIEDEMDLKISASGKGGGDNEQALGHGLHHDSLIGVLQNHFFYKYYPE